MLYKVVLALKSGGKSLSVTTQMNAIELYVYLVTFSVLFKVVLTLMSEDKTLVSLLGSRY